ncbi:MAG: DinB family protein [Acidobacteriota bacterium]
MRLLLAFLLTLTMFAADPVTTMYNHQVELVENDVLSLAKAMPANKYNFAPTQGEFKGVRTFGEQVRHLATMIYMTAAIVLGERSPYGPGANDNGPENLKTKEEILKYLTDSFAYAHKAMNSLTTANHLDPVPTYFGPMPRMDAAAGIAYHSYNHYGQMVVYARMNGIVPPNSVPLPAK